MPSLATVKQLLKTKWSHRLAFWIGRGKADQVLRRLLSRNLMEEWVKVLELNNLLTKEL